MRFNGKTDMRFRPYKPSRGPSPKSAIAAGMIEAGGPAALVGRLKRKRSVVYAYADPDHKTHAPFDAVCDLVAAGARAPVAHLAAIAGGVFMPGRQEAGSLVDLLSRAARAAGETQARAIASLADGKIDAVEGADLAETIDREIAALTGARAQLDGRGRA